MGKTLHFNEADHRYEGVDAHVSVVANESAFHRSVAEWCLQEQGIVQPTKQELENARKELMQVSHWHRYQKTGEGISVIPARLEDRHLDREPATEEGIGLKENPAPYGGWQ